MCFLDLQKLLILAFLYTLHDYNLAWGSTTSLPGLMTLSRFKVTGVSDSETNFFFLKILFPLYFNVV